MTITSIPSVITDTSRRDEGAPRCQVYQWCELDHRDPDIHPGLHEMHVRVSCGDCEAEFLLELTPVGDPRISSVDVDLGHIWLEPGEKTNTFRNAGALLAAAADEYERFTRHVTPKLKRHVDVTLALANRDV